jgi:hypothetical protein
MGTETGSGLDPRPDPVAVSRERGSAAEIVPETSIGPIPRERGTIEEIHAMEVFFFILTTAMLGGIWWELLQIRRQMLKES